MEKKFASPEKFWLPKSLLVLSMLSGITWTGPNFEPPFFCGFDLPPEVGDDPSTGRTRFQLCFREFFRVCFFPIYTENFYIFLHRAAFKKSTKIFHFCEAWQNEVLKWENAPLS